MIARRRGRVHLDRTNHRAMRWQRNESGLLGPVMSDPLLAKQTRPRAEVFGDGVRRAGLRRSSGRF